MFSKWRHHTKQLCHVNFVVKIREIGRKVRLRQLKCTQHSREFCLFCCTCSDLICAKCVSSEHQKHVLKDFNTLYDEHSSELMCGVSVIHSVNQGLIS